MIEVKKKKRGRKAIEVDAKEFQIALREFETVNNFPNRSQLWKAFEKTDFAKSISLSYQVAAIKAEKYKLEILTPKGKKGREAGVPIAKMVRKSRKLSDEIKNEIINAIPQEHLEQLSSTIERACKGSLKAKVKLKCLDCCNYTRVEVANCELISCPLWTARPYKNKERENLIPLKLTEQQSE